MKSVAVLFALALVVAPAAASAQISDTTPPTLVMPGSGFDPLAIDLTAGPVNVTVTLHLKDDLSGVSFDYQQVLAGRHRLQEPHWKPGAARHPRRLLPY